MAPLRTSNKDFLRSQSLVRRRRKRKIIRLWISFFLFCALVALLVWLISLPGMAIKKIVVVGNVNIGSEEVQRVGNSILDTKYLGLFSKRNAFLYPKQKISAALASLYPRISSVDLSTESFEILNIKIKERDAASVWCAAIQCYLVDENGYIFAEYHDASQAAGPGAISSVAGDTQVSTTSEEEASTSAVIASGDFEEYRNLPKLYGGDEMIGPEPIGKSIFTPKLYSDIRSAVSELQKNGFSIASVHIYSRDEIVFEISGNGKLIFSDRKPFADSLEDLKSSLKSGVFAGSSSGASSGAPVGAKAPQFEYIDVRFGNKVFYKMQPSRDVASTSLKTSSTTKSKI